MSRVTAKKIALEEKYPKTIKPAHLKEYLGLPTNSHDVQKGNEAPGVVTGLAWTAMGGEILFIESSVSKGKGMLSMTGNLGDVMKESAQIAFQYIKARPELTGLTYEEFMERDIHVHVPEGAVPKDGPSAGITMVSSMVSAYRKQAVKSVGPFPRKLPQKKHPHSGVDGGDKSQHQKRQVLTMIDAAQ